MNSCLAEAQTLLFEYTTFVLKLYQHFLGHLTFGGFLSSLHKENTLSLRGGIFSPFLGTLTYTYPSNKYSLARWLDRQNLRAERKKNVHVEKEWGSNREKLWRRPGRICENSALQGSSSPPEIFPEGSWRSFHHLAPHLDWTGFQSIFPARKLGISFNGWWTKNMMFQTGFGYRI